MVAAVGFDFATLRDAVSFGMGRIVAALVVVAVAYMLAAAAIAIMRAGQSQERRVDVAGLVLIILLAVYLLSSWHLHVVWFAIVSAGLLGIAALSIVVAEATALAVRVRPHIRGH